MAWESSRRRDRLTPEFWRNRKKVLDRDGETCQIRGEDCTLLATQVDHIVPVGEGGSDDIANLQSVCTTCHNRKTAEESKRAKQRRKDRATHRSAKMKHPGLT